MRITKEIIPVALLMLFSSCGFFQSKEDANKLANTYLSEVDWENIDQYPLFEGCLESEAREAQRNCFEKTLLDVLYAEISQQDIKVKKSISDTVMLHLVIDKEGQLLLVKVEKDTLIDQQIPRLEAMLRQSLKKLPKLYAGLKKIEAGDFAEMVPVEVSCTLPLVIVAN